LAAVLYNDGSTSGSATVTINNSTFSGNDIANAGTLTIGDTILTDANIGNFGSGTVTSLGYNLSSDAEGGDGTTGLADFSTAQATFATPIRCLARFRTTAARPSPMHC